MGLKLAMNRHFLHYGCILKGSLPLLMMPLGSLGFIYVGFPL